MDMRNAEPSKRWTASELSGIARTLYADSPPLAHALMTYRPYICPFEDLLPHVPVDSNVLDFGCGAGLFMGLLYSTGRLNSGYGIDVNPALIAVAKKMVERAENQVTSKSAKTTLRFESGDVFSDFRSSEILPVGPFDVVALVDVMHHVPRSLHRQLLEMLVARVKPGGTFLYKDMCRSPLWRAGANWFHDLVIAHQWIQYARYEWVEQAVAKVGMNLTHSARINRLWYGHDLRVFRKPA
jgi:2-polyprenyl-3-methyl-5-hydroxy-6-metoxy-1,4-benzoquinol methylase